MPKTRKYILPTFQKQNSQREKQVILSMISNGEGWHYLAAIKISASLRRITSKHDSDLYCLNCLYSFKTKSKLESPKKVQESRDFCSIVMPSEDNSILKSAGQSSCLGENTEQYINFSVPTETEVKRIEEGFTNQKWKRLNNT